MPDYTIRPLDESTWSAFADLVEANGGIFGGCWCMGMHPKLEAADGRDNRERKLERLRAGTATTEISLRSNGLASRATASLASTGGLSQSESGQP